MADYDLTVTDSGAGLDVILGKANTALQPADVGESVQGYDAATAKLDIAQSWGAKQTLSGGYAEKGATLTPAAGTLTIPLDGGNYGAAITAATALATSNAPTPPVCSSSVVELAFAGATFGDLSFPATWYWGSDGIPTISETRVILTLATSVTGAIDAYATGRAQVA